MTCKSPLHFISRKYQLLTDWICIHMESQTSERPKVIVFSRHYMESQISELPKEAVLTRHQMECQTSEVSKSG